ncbi:hypothetical protein BH23GEM10_BH23GEM10_15030 [soil metagenome]
MIAGLPVESWLLMIVAVGAGLVIEIAFLRAHRHDDVVLTAHHTTDTIEPPDSRDDVRAP